VRKWRPEHWIHPAGTSLASNVSFLSVICVPPLWPLWPLCEKTLKVVPQTRRLHAKLFSSEPVNLRARSRGKPLGAQASYFFSHRVHRGQGSKARPVGCLLGFNHTRRPLESVGAMPTLAPQTTRPRGNRDEDRLLWVSRWGCIARRVWSTGARLSDQAKRPTRTRVNANRGRRCDKTGADGWWDRTGSPHYRSAWKPHPRIAAMPPRQGPP
jgi:hypothetical protein